MSTEVNLKAATLMCIGFFVGIGLFAAFGTLVLAGRLYGLVKSWIM